MKRIAVGLLFLGFAGVIGCTGVDKVPEGTQAKRVDTRKAAETADFPAAVSKLLPPDQLDARNAHAQAKLLNQQLEREKEQFGRTATAQRE